MGAWSASITGNDTAQDMRYEYTAAFYYYDVPTAVSKLDEYVRNNMCDETDQEEWCNYFYSLADFMWKKGILTDDIKNAAINMIDSEFGLEAWAESGDKMLRDRKKVLEKFKAQLLSEQPAKKKIKPNTFLTPIFEDGDLIAIQLQTAEKPYTSNDDKPMSEDEFHSFDGKYILIQKIKCFASWSSTIVPEVKDYWAIFRLFDGVYDKIPTDIDITKLKDASMIEGRTISPLFTCESSMFYFKKRHYQVLGNFPTEASIYNDDRSSSIFLGINKPWVNPDSQFLAAMDKPITCRPLTCTVDTVKKICKSANRYGAYDYSLSKKANEDNRAKEENLICECIDKTFAQNGAFYEIHFGHVVGIISILNNEINNFYVAGGYQQLGLGGKLLEYAVTHSTEMLCMNITKDDKRLLHMCQKAGITVN